MITRFLIIANVIAYLWEISVAGPGMLSSFGGGNVDRIFLGGALIPAYVLQGGQWWRLITAGFLHMGLLHIGVNMMSLWFLGRFIEMALGGPRMLFVYVVSLLASSLGVVFFSAPDVPTLGASGAIFGLFGALFAIGLKLGPPGMQLVRDNVGILVINLILTFSVKAISWQAHIAGLLIGFVVTYVIFYPPRRVQPVVYDTTTGNELETEYQSPHDRQSQL